MSLLSPWFLLGALAVGLPLWLHLLQRDNPVRLPFASLMFFEKMKESRLLERRLRYLLLLALRLALIVLAALAFAKPVWERSASTAFGEIPALHLIVLDTSLSMSAAGRWDRAVAAAEAIVADLSPNDRAQVLAVGPGISVITERSNDKVELRSAIAGLAPGVGRNSYSYVVEATRSLAPEGDLPVEVHLISDLQNSAMPGRFSEVALPTFAKLDVTNVAEPNDQNWAIESVRGDVRAFGAENPKLEVTVAGYSLEAARKTVTFKIDGNVIGSESQEVPAMGRAAFTFAGFEPPVGFSRASFEITPGDDLAGDDVRLVAIDNSEPEPILFVTSDRRQRDALYFGAAVGASRSARFKLEVTSAGEAERRKPDYFALIVLSDIANLSTGFENKLREWTELGGAVLVAIGPAVSTRGSVPVSGRRVSVAPLQDRAGAEFQIAGQLDLSHAALGRVERFRGVKFFRQARVEATEVDDVLVSLADGSPLLIENPLGAGKVMVFASSFDNVWNDLPVQPVFVPFVVELARYLSGAAEDTHQATVDTSLALAQRREGGAAIQIVDPAGDRALSLSQSVEQTDVALDQLGFYEMQSARGVELIAVNPDPRESNFRPLESDTLTLWQATGRGGTEPTQTAGVGAESPIKPPPLKIWRFLLLLLVVVVLVESVIGNQHLNVRREV
ncbi:MAG: BatA domain-containing protein [Acidobacteria bacterium]|nr:BatA domain-containing protein [Acidobacteriota bacterium]MDA1236710.1 BatA domain-containing protein [Acidobacteriota bacterium]